MKLILPDHILPYYQSCANQRIEITESLIEAGFTSKVAQKRAIEHLDDAVVLIHDVLHDRYLDIDYSLRSAPEHFNTALSDLYYKMPSSIGAYRGAKIEELIRGSLEPEQAQMLLDIMASLREVYNRVKASPVVKGEPKAHKTPAGREIPWRLVRALADNFRDALANRDREAIDEYLGLMMKRRDEYFAATQTPEFKAADAKTKVAKRLEAAGGSHYQLEMFRYGPQTMRDRIEYDMLQNFMMRDVRLARKAFDELEIDTIESITFTCTDSSPCSIEGFFRIITPGQPALFLELRTILAGGYNIQCLHHRILINVSRDA